MNSPYSEFILPSAKIVKPFMGAPGSLVQCQSANFSDHFGYKRLGIHSVVLPPGARISLPHAESLEEEFVFVIRGTPHAWIDGYLHLLKPHSAVGFPSGTGIAHSFINNTNRDVELLVLGERTKPENLHVPPPVVVDCTQLQKSKGWHYAGDSETFCEFARLTDTLGLKALGIGYEVLAPGHRTSFPHAHKIEEEFAFVLSGTATIWLNGFTHAAGPGMAVAFLPGTNIAYSILNNTHEPLVYLMVGEAADTAGEDRVFYPQHAFRNEQCRKKNFLWEEDRPTNVTVGPHNGRPDRGIEDHLCFRLPSSADEKAILDIFKKSPAYFRKVEGCEPTLVSVRSAMTDGPPKRGESYLKEFLLIEYLDKPIGVVDMHFNHPEAGIAYLGMLVLTEENFGKGLGRRSYDLIEHYAKTQFATKTIRLGIADDNDGNVFWRKMGFLPNGYSYSYKGEDKTNQVVEFEKKI